MSKRSVEAAMDFSFPTPEKLRCSENIGEQLLCDALGMQIKTLRMVENGEKEPTLHQLAQLAGFFDTTVDYLLKGEDK